MKSHNLSKIIAHYIANCQGHLSDELKWFASQASFEDAVCLAAEARSSGNKRMNHQRRIPQSVLVKSKEVLLHHITQLQACETFEDLFDTVEGLIGGIKGIGELAVYDTALRIGAWLNLEPQYIYLHAGTRIGVSKLGLNTVQKRIPISDMPEPLRNLKAKDIENLLCIYKEALGNDAADITEILNHCRFSTGPCHNKPEGAVGSSKVDIITN